MNQLKFSKALHNEMKAHAQLEYPNECCGFFFGRESDGIRHVLEIQAVRNNQPGDQRRRFEISAYDYMQAERYAYTRELTLLGVYHSHPDHPAQPSKHDLKQAVPFFSYIIMAVTSDEVTNTTSWQLQDEKFVEEEIIIENQIETLN